MSEALKSNHEQAKRLGLNVLLLAMLSVVLIMTWKWVLGALVARWMWTILFVALADKSDGPPSSPEHQDFPDDEHLTVSNAIEKTHLGGQTFTAHSKDYIDDRNSSVHETVRRPVLDKNGFQIDPASAARCAIGKEISSRLRPCSKCGRACCERHSLHWEPQVICYMHGLWTFLWVMSNVPTKFIAVCLLASLFLAIAAFCFCWEKLNLFWVRIGKRTRNSAKNIWHWYRHN